MLPKLFLLTCPGSEEWGCCQEFPVGKVTSLSEEFVPDSPTLLPLLASPLTGRLHLLHKVVVGTSIEYVLWINRE